MSEPDVPRSLSVALLLVYVWCKRISVSDDSPQMAKSLFFYSDEPQTIEIKHKWVPINKNG